jgi:hypothetical protein
MPILNYTTTVDPIKTIGEITKNLVEHSANKIIVDYENGLPISLTFEIFYKGKPIYYSLPCNWENVYKVLEKQSDVPKKYKTKEQAIRTAWRIVKVWTDAQMAIIESEIVSMAEVFFPYAITKSGHTLSEDIFGTNLLLEQK